MSTESKVTIKQISHPDNPKLPAMFVGSRLYATPKTGKDGKTVTGIDENAYSVIILPAEEAKQTRDRLKKEREELERLLGKDLKPESPFWNTFFIPLDDEERELSSLNPLDRLHEYFLLANRYVAPSLDDIQNDPDYMNTLFYFHREEEVRSKKVQDQKIFDKAISQLLELSEKNPNKLKLLASYTFGFDINNLDPEVAYLKFKESFESADLKSRIDNVKKFVSNASKTPEQLGIKLILDKAVKKRFVISRGGIFKRGEVDYGRSYEEALDFLTSPENSGELADLRESLDRK